MPCAGTDFSVILAMPRTRRELGADREEKTQAWTNLELRKFLEAVGNERLYPLWLTLAMTGLRRGEALALRWADLDLERARLSVRRSLVPINGTVEVHEPKTSSWPASGGP